MKALTGLYHAAVWLAILFVISPMLLMMVVAFNPADYFSFPPQGFSLRWFAEIPGHTGYRNSVMNSLKLAATATALAVLISIPAALGLRRGDWKALELAVLSPLFFPLVIWSLGLLQLYGMAGINGTFLSLVLAHTVLVMPFIFRVVLQSLRETGTRYEEAAHSLGADKWTAFRKVTLPLIAPGVLVGAVFGFLISFTDVTLTMFISSSGNATFPVRVYSEQRSEGLNQIVLAWSAVITFVIFVISLAGEKLARWSRYF